MSTNYDHHHHHHMKCEKLKGKLSNRKSQNYTIQKFMSNLNWRGNKYESFFFDFNQGLKLTVF